MITYGSVKSVGPALVCALPTLPWNRVAPGVCTLILDGPPGAAAARLGAWQPFGTGVGITLGSLCWCWRGTGLVLADIRFRVSAWVGMSVLGSGFWCWVGIGLVVLSFWSTPGIALVFLSKLCLG